MKLSASAKASGKKRKASDGSANGRKRQANLMETKAAIIKKLVSGDYELSLLLLVIAFFH